MKSRILAIAAIALLASVTAFAQLEVVTNIPGGGPQGQPEDAGCVHDGEYAMRTTTALGDTSAMFVQADSTNGFDEETVFRAQFWFHPATMDLDHGRKHFIIAGLPGATSKQQAPFRVSFHRNANTGDKKVSFRCKVNCPDPLCTSAGGPKLTLAPDDWNLIQIEWAHNTPGQWDGVCRISIIDGPAAGQSSESPTTCRQYTLEGVKMGFLGGVWIHTSTVGKHCYDSFASFRTLAP